MNMTAKRTAPQKQPTPRTGGTHVLPVTVYWEDTDAGGVVYYANYLRFAERGRTELLRRLGVNQSRLAAETGVIFAVRRAAAEYIAPARLEDALEIVTSVRAVSGATVEMDQWVRRGDEVLVRMDITIACINARGRATRLPADIARAFESFASGALP